MAPEQNNPTIHRTPGVDEDGRPFIAVWTGLPNGETVGIRIIQDGEEPVSEERLEQAEVWVKHTLKKRAAASRKGGAA